MAGWGKYCMGGYGQIGVHRIKGTRACSSEHHLVSILKTDRNNIIHNCSMCKCL